MQYNKVFTNNLMYLMVLLVFVSVVGAGENNSIFQKAHKEKQALTGRAGSDSGNDGHEGRDVALGGGAEITALQASWITVDIPRPKDYRVHDFVTIIVNEVSKSGTKAKSKLERDNTIDAVLSDWIQLDNGRLRPDAQGGGDPKVGAGIEREFEGKGENDREDFLTVRITAEIVDVLPNGNLVLEATKSVATDEDVTEVTLTGMCRSSDIGADNSIVSSKLARMDIRKTHSGAVRDATKRGWLHKILDTINPF